jgi:hypothetical protein
MLVGMSRPSRSDYTRRSFLGRAAAAAAIPGAAAVAAELAGCSGAPHPAPHSAPHSAPHPGARPPRRPGPVAENARPGDPHWDIRHLGRPGAIAGYAALASVLAGQPVPLLVSTTARSFRVRAFRMGWYGGDLARLVWQSGSVRGHRQRRATLEHATNTVQTDWGPSVTVPTDGWPDGSYLLRLDAESGAQRFVPLTVRSASTAGKVVIKNSVATWQAYNLWGGYDLYNGPGGVADYANRSLAVSLDRPLDHQGAYLFLVHERKLIELAERLGLPLAYATSMDIAAQPRLLDGASALVSPGHDEYWSPPERAHVTAARDAGTNLAFLGANAMFRRTRLAPTKLGPRRMVICYKTSYLRDPLYGRDNALVTSDWREPPHPDPESALTGTLYESNPADADYVVTSPGAWLFRGTGVREGTSFRGLVGIEYDRVNPGYPVQRPIEVMSHSPLTCRGVNSYADSAYYTHAGGAGVFNTGTMRWVGSFSGNNGFGIDRRTGRFTRRVTANVLRAFADGPAAAKYPARDNLHRLHEWAGDPIAAQHDLWAGRR